MNIAWKPTVPLHLAGRSKAPEKYKLVRKPGGNVDWSNKENISYLSSRVRCGLTHQQIADELGVPVTTINWGCKRNKLSTKKGRKPNLVISRRQWDLVIDLRAAGVDYATISKQINVSKSVLANQIHNSESVQMLIKQKRNRTIANILRSHNGKAN